MDVKVIRHLLVSHAPLVAVVAAAKIVAGTVPAGTAMPAIGITHVSGNWWRKVAGQSGYCVARTQVTVMAANYPQQKQIMALVRAAVQPTRGVVAGVNVDSIHREPDGPDFSNDDASICMQCQDFMVTFNE